MGKKIHYFVVISTSKRQEKKFQNTLDPVPFRHKCARNSTSPPGGTCAGRSDSSSSGALPLPLLLPLAAVTAAASTAPETVTMTEEFEEEEDTSVVEEDRVEPFWTMVT